LALRPDPVGDHLMLTELTQYRALLPAVLERAGEAGMVQTVLTLTRAGQNDTTGAAALIVAILRGRPEAWLTVFGVALRMGGVAAEGLAAVCAEPGCPLPLDKVSDAIPFSSTGLFELALQVDGRRLAVAREQGRPETEVVELLVRVSLREGNAGDRDAALVSITEAVDHYRRLAQANPAAYLPDLAGSLNNLSRLRPAETVNDDWQRAIDALAHPSARAILRAAWTIWLISIDCIDAARDQLKKAANEADLPISLDAGERAATVLAMKARADVRAAASRFDPSPAGLPIWATAPIDGDTITAVNAYAAASDWPTQRVALDQYRAQIHDPGFRSALVALTHLYPANDAPRQLLNLLDEIEAADKATVYAHRQDEHDRLTLLVGWIQTPTWSGSKAYYLQHRAALHDETTVAILSQIDDSSAAQHLAILDLVIAAGTDATFTAVIDPTAAEELALDAVETGDLDRLDAVFAAAPNLTERPVTWLLAACVLLHAHDRADDAAELTDQLVAQATPVQLQAHAIRLRALLEHVPDLPYLDR